MKAEQLIVKPLTTIHTSDLSEAINRLNELIDAHNRLVCSIFDSPDANVLSATVHPIAQAIPLKSPDFRELKPNGLTPAQQIDLATVLTHWKMVCQCVAPRPFRKDQTSGISSPSAHREPAVWSCMECGKIIQEDETEDPRR